jgi:hypothetical protein
MRSLSRGKTLACAIAMSLMASNTPVIDNLLISKNDGYTWHPAPLGGHGNSAARFDARKNAQRKRVVRDRVANRKASKQRRLQSKRK